MRDPNMKEKIVFERPVSRRRVLTASALLAAAGFASSPLAAAVANAVADFGVYEWTACVINAPASRAATCASASTVPID